MVTAHSITAHNIATPAGRIHYTRSGQGAPLLFLHSNGNSGVYWAPFLPRFGDHFTCYNIDTLGWGGSEVPDRPCSVPELADCIAQVMDAAEIARASLCATHAGALFAFDFAARCPDRVDKLVLDGLPFYDHDTGQAFYDRAIKPHMTDHDSFDRGVYPRFTWAQAEHRDPTSYASGHGMLRAEWERQAPLRERRRYWQRLSYDAILAYDGAAQAHRVTAPVLLTVGSRDVLREFAEPAHAALPGSRLEVFPTEPGTSAPTGAPDAFFAAAMAFLHQPTPA